MQKLLYKKPNECSGGERQRAAIARAIVSKPKILVCDEPTGNLDTVNSHELLGMLTKLNQEGTSIILVTHDSMIASYAKKFIYLRDGKIINEINRNNASQVDFFNEIVKITTQDSLLKLFNDTTDSKNVFSNNTDSSVTNSEVVIENEVANKVSETSNNEGMEVNVINKETKPVRRIVYAIFAGLEYDESSSKRYRILYFEEDTIDFQFSNIEKLHVTYPEVEKAIISMCSRYVPSFPMPENRFYLDLDLVLKDGKTYKFEVNNQRNATSLFDVLHQHNIKVEDPCGFEELYRSKGDYLVRHRWLLYNFRKIAKQYHLDNPRGASKSFY
ncbi:ATP-binding cassette domain-containing protein [Coprobacillaceae bacterium CR2/5/TPMF4]|nr:ATP-binding cassette domain-containing protein [Coprobacillaceae bacterium CR2/5/TPMF4]